jgi:hypothetical protein
VDAYARHHAHTRTSKPRFATQDLTFLDRAEFREMHLRRSWNFMLIRCSARWTAGKGLSFRLSERGGGGGSSLSASTGENAEGDPSPRPNELPYSVNNALITSCREGGADRPKPCRAATSVIVDLVGCEPRVVDNMW